MFLPYELCLTQRRAMIRQNHPDNSAPGVSLGLFLIGPEPDQKIGGREQGGDLLREHIFEILRPCLRDSDILGMLNTQEHLAVIRDVDPEQGHVAAQRMLAAASHSQLLMGAGLRLRIGFLIYPLSTQPNFPPMQWPTLLELARYVAAREEETGPLSACGVLIGEGDSASMLPETDLVGLAGPDPGSFISAGMLRIQRIHVWPEV